MAKIYFFKGNQYIRWTPGAGLDDGYPKSLRNHWDSFMANGIDAAVFRGVKKNGQHKLYLFKGDQYIRWSVGYGKDPGYPKSLRNHWYPSFMSNGIDAAVYSHDASEPTQSGVKKILFFNCHTDRRGLNIWTRNISARSNWQWKGSLSHQNDSGGTCPAANAQPFELLLQSNNLYEIVCTDCQQNDPTLTSCRRWWSGYYPVTGNSNGSILSLIVT